MSPMFSSSRDELVFRALARVCRSAAASPAVRADGATATQVWQAQAETSGLSVWQVNAGLARLANTGRVRRTRDRRRYRYRPA